MDNPKPEINKRISLLIKELNYLRQNPKLEDKHLLALEAAITKLLEKLKTE